MLRTYPFLISLGFCVSMAPCTQAQSHFTSCLDGIGNVFNATIIISIGSIPDVHGNSLAVDSEIAVFSSDPAYPDLCVGLLVWQGSHGYIAVWGDDDLTSEREGLVASEVLRYRVWDSTTGVEYGNESVNVSYAQGHGQYSDDAVMILHNLNVTAAPVATESAAEVPEEIQLYGNYPNPFNDATTISFGLPRTTRVTMEVYDLLGRRVTTLLSSTLPAGRHTVRWQVHDTPSGVYLCLMQAESTVLAQEFTVVK